MHSAVASSTSSGTGSQLLEWRWNRAKLRPFATATSNAELRHLVGLFNFYHCFIDEYADIAAPLRACAHDLEVDGGAAAKF